MKKILLTLVCSLFYCTFSFAYTYISFAKTRGSSPGWTSGQATFHNCSIIVSPKGLYSEVSITLEISALGSTNILSGDTLEANLNFDLPQNALVIDSWLWINDTSKVQADHMGKSTAVSIYNNIVNNIRRDPSLLTKNSYSSDNYNLKIYPFFGLQKRKFRITYLVPIGENSSQYTIDVPLYLLKSTYNYYSQTVFPDVHLKVYETSTISNPSLTISTSNFSVFQGTAPIKEATISSAFINSYSSPYFPSDNTVKLAFNKSTSSNIKFYHSPTSTNSGFFEFSINPSKLLNFNNSTRICLVIDQDQTNWSYPLSSILPTIKESLNQRFDSTSYFNVVHQNNGIQRFSNIWQRITPNNLSAAFDDSTKFKSDTTNSETLLSNAINFINGQDSIGYIFMVTSNRSYYNNLDSSRNKAIRLVNKLTKKTSIDIINHNLTQSLLAYSWDPNSYYYGYHYGNTVFYGFVSSLTIGTNINSSSYWINSIRRTTYNSNTSYYWDYYKSDLTTFKTNITNSLSKYLGKIIESIDLIISPTNGFSYQKFSILGGESISYANSANPISLVGKYVGTFPMQLNLVYTYKGIQTITPLTINQQDAQNEPNMVATHWNGNYIRKYEGSSDKNILASVATTALKYRILSKMTAMLALEPSLGGKICTTCDENQPFTNNFYQNYVNTIGDSLSKAYIFNEDLTNNQPIAIAIGLTDNEVISEDYLTLSTYPNPASEKITFKFDNPKLQTSTLEIYDVTGSKVYSTEIQSDNTKTEFEWNLLGTNGSKLSNGFYVAILTIGDKKIRLKIIIQS